MRGLVRVFLSTLVCAAGIPLLAQSRGTINGSVTDASGGLVPAATVTAALVDQLVRRSVTTGSDAYYSLWVIKTLCRGLMLWSSRLWNIKTRSIRKINRLKSASFQGLMLLG